MKVLQIKLKWDNTVKNNITRYTKNKNKKIKCHLGKTISGNAGKYFLLLAFPKHFVTGILLLCSFFINLNGGKVSFVCLQSSLLLIIFGNFDCCRNFNFGSFTLLVGINVCGSISNNFLQCFLEINIILSLVRSLCTGSSWISDFIILNNLGERLSTTESVVIPVEGRDCLSNKDALLARSLVLLLSSFAVILEIQHIFKIYFRIIMSYPTGQVTGFVISVETTVHALFDL